MSYFRFNPVGIVMGCVVFSAISLSGCAMIPDLGTPPPMKTVTQLKSDQSFPHQNGQWPKDDWWKNTVMSSSTD